jgi:predicted O-methyltransferase YrrM
LDYVTFFNNFGASARTKNIYPDTLMAPRTGPRDDKRRFVLPAASMIPKEFIRLCPWVMEYLFTVARRARLGIVETGRFNGGSLFIMACAAPDYTPIYSIDLAPRNDKLLLDLLAQHCSNSKVELIIGDSQKIKCPQIGPIDLLFIDGDHSYDGCMMDILNWYDRLVIGGHLVFHDSYLGSHGVQDAIIDFMADHSELQIVQSPFIGADYWHYPAGSIAHLIKRRA